MAQIPCPDGLDHVECLHRWCEDGYLIRRCCDGECLAEHDADELTLYDGEWLCPTCLADLEQFHAMKKVEPPDFVAVVKAIVGLV